MRGGAAALGQLFWGALGKGLKIESSDIVWRSQREHMYYEWLIAEGGPIAPGAGQDAEVGPGFRSGHLNLIADTGTQLQPQCGDHFEDGIKTWAAFT